MAQQPERPGNSDSESIGFSSLDKVVESKDENFLRLVASYEPDECFKRLCSSELDGKNIFHIAASDHKNYRFMKTAMEILPAPVVQRLLCQEGLIEKCNPLHVSASECLYKMVKLILDYYRRSSSSASSSHNVSSTATKPWLQLDHYWRTPLHIALRRGPEQSAMEILTMDVELLSNIDTRDRESPLYLALYRGFSRVALKILTSTSTYSTTCPELLSYGSILSSGSILSYAPNCSEAFLRLLVESYPQLMQDEDYDGQSILHSWIEIGQLWPFEYILKGNDIDIDLNWRDGVNKMLLSTDRKGRNPLHLAALSSSEQVMVEILKLIFDVDPIHIGVFAPWRKLSYDGDTPMKIALSNKSERLALLFLSTGYPLRHEEKYLMLEALEYECHQVVKFLLDSSTRHGLFDDDCGDKFIRFGNRNILHLVWKSTEDNAKFIIENWPELINEDDEHGKKPLEKASEAGKPWLVILILQKDRTSIIQAPFAWTEACKNGHVSTVLAFVDHSPYFRYTCHEHKETPLHHIEKASYKEYQTLLEHRFIKELKNTQNKQGETPLHIAIKSKNKDLAEVLLTTDGVDWNIKDNKNNTAKDLLENVCEGDHEWAIMCKAIGVDLLLKTTYIQEKTDLSQMRETISLVAALLATITFTAGFTVPGGFDQSKGFALLSTNPAFLVFLVSNTYAMCCSMLILFCVIWSVVSNRSKSSSLLDRSLQLLKQSLYGTLLAFMTGVYSVVHQKSLWVGIVVIVMSSIVVMLAQRQVLYAALAMLNYYTDKAPGVKLRLLSCWKRPASIIQSLFRRNHGNAPNAAVSDNQTTQV